ncbi:MAG TPA: CrcB family protein, partial [Blastocatellia bacterium]|nr:CrcB family protein [Blastocatellia bacterium]
FPFATLIINISGCFVLGLFLTLVTERIRIDPMWTLAISTGFVGSYTTFSTFEFESFKLIEAGSSFSALGNISISLILGFVAVWGGVALAHRIDNRRAVRSPAPHSRPAVTVNAEVEEVLADESF